LYFTAFWMASSCEAITPITSGPSEHIVTVLFNLANSSFNRPYTRSNSPLASLSDTLLSAGSAKYPTAMPISQLANDGVVGVGSGVNDALYCPTTT
jgi:hypothetical protein